MVSWCDSKHNSPLSCFLQHVSFYDCKQLISFLYVLQHMSCCDSEPDAVISKLFSALWAGWSRKLQTCRLKSIEPGSAMKPIERDRNSWCKLTTHCQRYKGTVRKGSAGSRFQPSSWWTERNIFHRGAWLSVTPFCANAHSLGPK